MTEVTTIELVLAGIGLLQAGLGSAIWYRLGNLQASSESFEHHLEVLESRMNRIENKAMEGRK